MNQNRRSGKSRNVNAYAARTEVANLWATAVLHPVVRTYPKKSYLQPSLFVWRRDGTLAHEWRQTESSLTNHA